MNFLAHIYLSWKDENLMLGNFIADMVKGRQIEQFSREVVRGIRLHRKIDEYTDSHPVVSRSKDRIRAKYRHYSGVVVDMYYDHYLAKNWSDYSDEPLDLFVQSAYNVLMKNYVMLPKRAKFILPLMIGSNWLVNYADLNSFKRHMEGMAKRTHFESGMEHAVDDLKQHYNEFRNDFREFFPDLAAFSKRFIEKSGGFYLPGIK
ncbi:MAG: ACP phosphodiesterase [Bacteroidales bacterium]